RVVTTAPPVPPRGLWCYRLDRRRALLGGATSEGGNVYAWCRQMLKLPGDDQLEAALAALPAADHGLTVLPHWAGERAPRRRGAALLALEALGVLPDLTTARQELGETFVPDRARHARYRDALERQRRFDDRV